MTQRFASLRTAILRHVNKFGEEIYRYFVGIQIYLYIKNSERLNN